MKPTKIVRVLIANVTILAVFAATACVPSAAAKTLAPEYYSPLKDANYVSKGATIAVRYGPALNERNIQGLKFIVSGSKSGLHSGQTVLADDRQTVIFKPAVPFTPGEQVKVQLNNLRLNWRTYYDPLSYTFTVAVNQQPGEVATSSGRLTKLPPAHFPIF
jgi:hypothetical protein